MEDTQIKKTGVWENPLLPSHDVVCSTSLMASLIRSVGGLSKCFYQGLWLAVLSADVIGQSINKRGVAWEFPYYRMVSSSVSARFLYGFPYRFQRAWTVLCSMKHPLDVVRVGAWNRLSHDAPLFFFSRRPWLLWSGIVLAIVDCKTSLRSPRVKILRPSLDNILRIRNSMSD